MATGRPSLCNAARAQLCDSRGHPSRGVSGSCSPAIEQRDVDRKGHRIGDCIGSCPPLIECITIAVFKEILQVKTKFMHRIGLLRTRTQRSGTQCNGTRTRWLFELPMPMVDRSGSR